MDSQNDRATNQQVVKLLLACKELYDLKHKTCVDYKTYAFCKRLDDFKDSQYVKINQPFNADNPEFPEDVDGHPCFMIVERPPVSQAPAVPDELQFWLRSQREWAAANIPSDNVKWFDYQVQFNNIPWISHTLEVRDGSLRSIELAAFKDNLQRLAFALNLPENGILPLERPEYDNSKYQANIAESDFAGHLLESQPIHFETKSWVCYTSNPDQLLALQGIQEDLAKLVNQAQLIKIENSPLRDSLKDYFAQAQVQVVSFVEQSSLQDAKQRLIQERNAWLEQRKLEKKADELYVTLETVLHNLERKGESLELMAGTGLLRYHESELSQASSDSSSYEDDESDGDKFELEAGKATANAAVDRALESATAGTSGAATAEGKGKKSSKGKNEEHGIRHPVLLRSLRLQLEPVGNGRILVYDNAEQCELCTSLLAEFAGSYTTLEGLYQDVGLYPWDIEKSNDLLSKLTTCLGANCYFNPQADFDDVVTHYGNQNAAEICCFPIMFIRSRRVALSEAVDLMVKKINAEKEILQQASNSGNGQVSLDEEKSVVPVMLRDLMSRTSKSAFFASGHGTKDKGNGDDRDWQDYSDFDDDEVVFDSKLAAYEARQLNRLDGVSSEILLTKPANTEQLQIAENIENASAVLVQGPPGTGKTHTIANLIGHFLSQGKTVLVVSEKSDALRVLKDKVEPQLQDLCLSVLNESNQDTSKALQGIIEQFNDAQLHSEKNRRAIERLKRQRDELCQQLTDLRQQLALLVFGEYQRFEVDGKVFNAIEAAQVLAKKQGQIDLMLPPISEEKPACPLTLPELQELYATNVSVSPSIENHMRDIIPELASLESVERFSALCSAYIEAQQQQDELISAFAQAADTATFRSLTSFSFDFSQDSLVVENESEVFSLPYLNFSSDQAERLIKESTQLARNESLLERHIMALSWQNYLNRGPNLKDEVGELNDFALKQEAFGELCHRLQEFHKRKFQLEVGLRNYRFQLLQGDTFSQNEADAPTYSADAHARRRTVMALPLNAGDTQDSQTYEVVEFEPRLTQAGAENSTETGFQGSATASASGQTWGGTGARVQQTTYQNLGLTNEQIDDLAQLIEKLKQTLSKSKLVRRFASIIHDPAKDLAKVLRVNDHELRSIDDCERALEWLELAKLYQDCRDKWNVFTEDWQEPDFALLDPAGKHPENIALDKLKQVKQGFTWAEDKFKPFINTLEKFELYLDMFYRPNLNQNLDQRFNSLLQACQQVLPQVVRIAQHVYDARHKHQPLQAYLVTLQQALTQSKQLAEQYELDEQNELAEQYDLAEQNELSDYALEMDLESRLQVFRALVEAVQNLNVEAYAAQYALVQDIWQHKALFEKRQSLLERLGKVDAQWAHLIAIREGVYGQDTVARDILSIWQWRNVKFVLDRSAQQSVSQLQEQAAKVAQEYRKVTAEYAAKLAWNFMFERLEGNSAGVKDLKTVEGLIAKCGNGKSKSKAAENAQRDLRHILPRCRKLVPVWIMPLSSIFSSFKADSRMFDVLIVDEASQVHIYDLVLLFLAKKCIIVGDDKQVTPEGVGKKLDDQMAIVRKYLDDCDFSSDFNLNTSLYEFAKRNYSTIMLREHFRCVPEIINFCNLQFYDNRIKVLRDGTSSNLKPAILEYYVKEGQRDVEKDGGIAKNNYIEALHTVALLKACFDNPAYANKSFGVIVMLNHEAQIPYLEALISQYIPVKQQVDHKLRCGSAPDFQGDERDVILMSLVESNPAGMKSKKYVTLNNPEMRVGIRQKYNVAVSRARDQLWIVTSLDWRTELDPRDMRYMLLQYAHDPAAYVRDCSELEQSIQKHSESDFEIRMAHCLNERGYSFEQQYKVGNYRLDFVVKYQNHQIALECDGERYHSSREQIERDLERQTILERLGWRFVRVRGSQFYRNQEQAIDEMVEAFKCLGIYPTSVSGSDQTESDGGETERLTQSIKDSAKSELAKFQDKTYLELIKKYGYDDVLSSICAGEFDAPDSEPARANVAPNALSAEPQLEQVYVSNAQALNQANDAQVLLQTPTGKATHAQPAKSQSDKAQPDTIQSAKPAQAQPVAAQPTKTHSSQVQSSVEQSKPQSKAPAQTKPQPQAQSKTHAQIPVSQAVKSESTDVLESEPIPVNVPMAMPGIGLSQTKSQGMVQTQGKVQSQTLSLVQEDEIEVHAYDLYHDYPEEDDWGVPTENALVPVAKPQTHANSSLVFGPSPDSQTESQFKPESQKDSQLAMTCEDIAPLERPKSVSAQVNINRPNVIEGINLRGLGSKLNNAQEVSIQMRSRVVDAQVEEIEDGSENVASPDSIFNAHKVSEQVFVGIGLKLKSAPQAQVRVAAETEDETEVEPQAKLESHTNLQPGEAVSASKDDSVQAYAEPKADLLASSQDISTAVALVPQNLVRANYGNSNDLDLVFELSDMQIKHLVVKAREGWYSDASLEERITSLKLYELMSRYCLNGQFYELDDKFKDEDPADKEGLRRYKLKLERCFKETKKKQYKFEVKNHIKSKLLLHINLPTDVVTEVRGLMMLESAGLLFVREAPNSTWFVNVRPKSFKVFIERYQRIKDFKDLLKAEKKQQSQ